MTAALQCSIIRRVRDSVYACISSFWCYDTVILLLRDSMLGCCCVRAAQKCLSPRLAIPRWNLSSFFTGVTISSRSGSNSTLGRALCLLLGTKENGKRSKSRLSSPRSVPCNNTSPSQSFFEGVIGDRRFHRSQLLSHRANQARRGVSRSTSFVVTPPAASLTCSTKRSCT